MDFFISVVKGIFLGAGAILPGISSGVLCVIFGIYERLVDSILGLFRDFKKNIHFLFPIAIGGIIGFFLLGNLLNLLFHSYENECKFLFLGLILGSFPALLKQVNQKKKFRLSFLVYPLLSFCFGLLLFFLENKIHRINVNNTLQNNFIFLFLSGFAMSAGVIIPGISSTVILMCFGTYYLYLESIATFHFSTLFPMGIGLVCGSLFFLVLIRFLLKKYSIQTYYAIIGFVLGSTLVLIPNQFSLFPVFLFFVGFFLTIKQSVV